MAQVSRVIADSSVTSAKILDGTIATADLAAASVTSAKLAAGASAATFVTALPGSPVDGQEVYYQSTTAGTGGGASDTMATTGAVWHLRYNSSATGSYKWQFVGGGKVSNRVATQEFTSTTNTYVDLATVGPVLTVPLAGDYFVQWGANHYAVTGSTLVAMGIGFGPSASVSYPAGGNAGVQWVIRGQLVSTSSQYMALAAADIKTGMAANDLIRAKYFQNQAAGAYWDNRWINVIPIRVG